MRSPNPLVNENTIIITYILAEQHLSPDDRLTFTLNLKSVPSINNRNPRVVIHALKNIS